MWAAPCPRRSAGAANLATAETAASGQAHRRPDPAGNLPRMRVVTLHRAYEARLRHTRPGKISGIVYARGKQPETPAGQRHTLLTCSTEPACPLVYQPNSGPVQHAPTVYLVLWGPNWSTDPNQAAVATHLKNLYKGLGARQTAPRDTWSTILSQYSDS